MLFAENWHRCGLFGKNSHLRCFVAIFIADVFTYFLCYFFGAKSALVLIFTLLESLIGEPDYVRPPFPLIVEKIPSEMEVALLHKEHLGTSKNIW